MNGAGGGPQAPGRATYSTGENVKLPKLNPELSGYSFQGWNTSADGSGQFYLPESSFAMPNSDIILYAQWKSNPIKITQLCGDNEVRISLEWKDGGRQGIVYSKDLVGFGNSYDFNPIVGGFAILIRDGVKYIHTSYPSDYNSHGRAIVTISSEKGVLLRASGSGVADRQGELSQLNSVTYADKVKLSVSGNIIDADANTNVELTFRADAPRMVLIRSKIEYTKPTEVKRLYHRLIHADPRKLLRPFSYL